ncbi:acyltransferase family protein [Microbacterium sp. NPDC077184]|uniref:acyltransferase family protein n=1 Tax=Microbacterium sp. NPDC077184 TaxID=3154764 RepID=UPI003441B44A
MDVTRGFAIFLVITYHGGTILTRFVEPIPEAIAWAGDFFAPFRMPLLMFLSGMLLYRSLSKSTRVYFLGKLRSIGWPYLVWTAISLTVTAQWSLWALSRIPIVPPTYLWYLWFLLAFYALAWVIARVGINFAYVAAAAAIAAAFAPEEHRISRFLFLFAFFCLGHWYQSQAWPHSIGRQWRTLVAVACAAVVIAAGLLAVASPEALRYKAAYIWAPLAGIALVLAVAPGIQPKGIGLPLKLVGLNSIVFYVSHFGAIWICYWWLAHLGASAPFFFYAIGVAFAFAVGWLLSKARQNRAIDALFVFPARSKSRVDTTVLPTADPLRGSP